MKKYSIKLRHLVFGVIALSFLLSFVSSIISSYQGTAESIKEHSLETNRVYAEKLSQMVDLYLENALETLEYSTATISNSMDRPNCVIRRSRASSSPKRNYLIQL